MTEQWAVLDGEIQTRLGYRRLAARLSALGIRAEVRESCHYTSGWYILISLADEFTLERTKRGTYLVHAAADTLEELSRAASQVSIALASLDIRHRFELSHPDSDIEEYMHHDWPQ